MTEEQRAELEKLATAATGGDWEISAVRTVDGNAMICGGGEGHDYGLIAEVTLDADAAYIVAACKAVPDLLATIARLEAEKVKDGERADRWRDACGAKDGQLCELRAEVHRLSSRARDQSQ